MKMKFQLVACLAAAAFVSPAWPAVAGFSEDAPRAPAGGEFVVSFSGTPEAATTAIEAAGGSVKDVTSQVGVALVPAPVG